MIGAMLNNVRTRWAVPLAGYIGSLTYDLTNICTIDPPALPVFTPQDVLDLVNVYNPVANIPASQKFQQMVAHYLWYQVCKCDADPQPAAPAAAPDPGVAVNPTVAPPILTDRHCYSVTQRIRTHDGRQVLHWKGPPLGDSGIAYDLGFHWFSQLYGRILPFANGDPLDWFEVPAGATSFSASSFAYSSPFDHPTNAIRLLFYDGAGNAKHQFFIAMTEANTPTNNGPHALDPSVRYVNVAWDEQDHGFIFNADVEATVIFDCAAGTGNVVSECCPPDDIANGQLERILGLVTLIQRQLAPFAYVPGAEHAGLTGEGSIAVQGLIGARLELEEWGPSVGEESGDPNVLFDAGWINWGSADGVTPRERLTAEQMLSLPAACGAFTSIHYSLGDGVVLRITELRREP